VTVFLLFLITPVTRRGVGGSGLVTGVIGK
jgi:hypothetical protein